MACPPSGVCQGRPATVDRQDGLNSACWRCRPARGGESRRARVLAEDFPTLDLYIGNKNDSSWSLRAWLLMEHFGIPFREHLVSVAGRDYNPALKPLAGNARVPCLHDGGFQVWESIAIAEFLAERHPELWLAGARARARARCISAEMHAGLVALRTVMPMNLKLRSGAGRQELGRIGAGYRFLFPSGRLCVLPEATPSKRSSLHWFGGWLRREAVVSHRGRLRTSRPERPPAFT